MRSGSRAEKYLSADEYPSPIGPQGRVILKVAAGKVNTPGKLGM